MPALKQLATAAVLGAALALPQVAPAQSPVQSPAQSHSLPPVYAGNPLSPKTTLQVLENPGFRIGYSDLHRQPLWVGFVAESVDGKARLGSRPANFSADLRVQHPVESRNYLAGMKEAGYTRGHLAPNYLIGKLYGRDAQLATFLMSNISPQKRRLNSLLWQRLEEAEADVAAPALQQLFVLTGPLFGPSPERMKSGVPLPVAFYRIWLDLLPDGTPRTLVFIVPQQVCGNEPLSEFLSSVDEVERRSGLDFFAALDDDLENRMEADTRRDGWLLERYDRTPPRYADKFPPGQC